jgi:hypothetical protein
VSPLSNNALFFDLLSNPFPDFFRRGLNVSLSTDDPLMFHQTREPLIEEYAIAAKVWGFTPNDLCEIARNSCLQSGFGHAWKTARLGNKYFLSSSLGNDPALTHVSDVRCAFRYETYHSEMLHLERAIAAGGGATTAGASADASRTTAAASFTPTEAAAATAADVATGVDRLLPIPRAMYTAEQEFRVLERETLRPEAVLHSTLDQDMEQLQREAQALRDAIRATKKQTEAVRVRNAAIVGQIADVGRRLQEEEERVRQAAATEARERAEARRMRMTQTPPRHAGAVWRDQALARGILDALPYGAAPGAPPLRSYMRYSTSTPAAPLFTREGTAPITSSATPPTPPPPSSSAPYVREQRQDGRLDFSDAASIEGTSIMMSPAPFVPRVPATGTPAVRPPHLAFASGVYVRPESLMPSSPAADDEAFTVGRSIATGGFASGIIRGASALPTASPASASGFASSARVLPQSARSVHPVESSGNVTSQPAGAMTPRPQSQLHSKVVASVYASLLQMNDV